ncbi:MAG: N-acetylneuraminate synthase family protein [Nitrospinaceae bacterium]|jgi:sialic acid synthase SpsE|nr:N-acetylneuraminate synthase family protein [Nitrospinaceae bacterium]
MGTNEEIETALKTIRAEGNEDITLLHRVSNYPSQYHEMNLACLQESLALQSAGWIIRSHHR